MDFNLIIGFAKWFLLRQVSKYCEKIDWSKVASDFVDRIAAMLPPEVFGSLEKANTKDFIVGFGKAYDARGLIAAYGTQHYMAAFEQCFGDTDAAKLSAGQAAYISSLKPVEIPIVVADEPVEIPIVVADEPVVVIEPEVPEEKGGFLGAGKGKSKKTV